MVDGKRVVREDKKWGWRKRNKMMNDKKQRRGEIKDNVFGSVVMKRFLMLEEKIGGRRK